MREATVRALNWALKLELDPATLRVSAAVALLVFGGLVMFALTQYRISERRWGLKLVLGLLGGATLVGLGASAFHWIAGALYGIGYLLTWLVWVLTGRWSWWRRALARGLTAGLTLGPWLWLGATEKASTWGNESELAAWLLAPSGLIWFWMLLGAVWMLLLVDRWGCWRWPVLRPGRRRWLVVTWAVLGVLGLNWYVAGRLGVYAVCWEEQHWRLCYVLLSRPGSQWYRDEHGWTPVHSAAYGGKAGAIRLLLAAGADVNAKDEDSGTPIHWAVRQGSGETIRLLLAAGADVNAKDSQDWTPLHSAVRFYPNADVIPLLLDAGADVNAKDACSAQTPLHWAVKEGKTEAIRLLLAAGSSANAQDISGMTPLRWAAWCGSTEALHLLLTAGARVNERNEEGATVLDLAETDECRKVLRDAGGKTGAELEAEKPAPAK